MMRSRSGEESLRTPAVYLTSLIILVFLLFGIISLLLGHDANWDIKHYHYYTPYAVLHSRLQVDHNAASLQTTLNPTLDLLTTYPFLSILGPIGFSFLLGGLQSLSFVFLLLIAYELLKDTKNTPHYQLIGMAVMAACLGLSGALVISEIGTSFGDLTLSVLNLSALWLCLKASRPTGKSRRISLVAGAGLLIGLSAGLKLTNVIYSAALLSALAVTNRQNRFMIFTVMLTSIGIGILLAHGWWSLHLWKLYGNPIFPLFNGIFQSPSYPARNFADTRFLPKGWLRQLAYPFFFSWNHQTAEVPFVDFRFPIAYICFISLGIIALRERRSTKSKYESVTPQYLFLCFFMFVAYVLWQATSSIQRYAITLELIIPLYVLSTFVVLFGRRSQTFFIGYALLLMTTTIPANWGRLAIGKGPFYAVAENQYSIVRDALQNAAIILGPPPLAYLAPALAVKSAAWIGQPFNESDEQAAMRKLRAKEKIYLITRDTDRDIKSSNLLLRQYGLPELSRESCQNFSSNSGSLLLCLIRSQART